MKSISKNKRARKTVQGNRVRQIAYTSIRATKQHGQWMTKQSCPCLNLTQPDYLSWLPLSPLCIINRGCFLTAVEFQMYIKLIMRCIMLIQKYRPHRGRPSIKLNILSSWLKIISIIMLVHCHYCSAIYLSKQSFTELSAPLTCLSLNTSFWTHCFRFVLFRDCSRSLDSGTVCFTLIIFLSAVSFFYFKLQFPIDHTPTYFW